MDVRAGMCMDMCAESWHVACAVRDLRARVGMREEMCTDVVHRHVNGQVRRPRSGMRRFDGRVR